MSSKPVKLSLAGAGLVGRWHADAIRALAPEVDLLSIVDPDRQAASYADGLGIPWYSSLKEMFAAETPDGVILATPNQVHLENALDCTEARCPMLIEKPIAVTSQEAERIVHAAGDKGVPVLVGHHRRHNPLIRQAKKIIDGGTLGPIVTVQGTCWLLKPDAYFEPDWRRRPGAGPVMVNAIHDVDLLRHLCGDVAGVQAVTSSAARGFATEDSAVALLSFRSGALGTLNVSDSAAAPWSWELTSGENPVYPTTRESCYLIGGTRGSLSLPDLRVWSHGEDGHWKTGITAAGHPVADADPLREQIRHFAAVIRGEEEPLVSGLEGMKSLQVIEAILLSAREARAVQLPSF